MSRLGVARILIGNATKDPVRHAAISMTQKDALMELVKQDAATLATMTAEARARVVSAAACVEWHSDHVGEIMAAFQTESPTKKKEPKAKRPMQQFTPNIVEYFTAKEWTDMESQPPAAKMDLLITRTLQLGGVCLGELCKARLANLLCDFQGLATATQTVKQNVLDIFKDEYKRRVRKVKECDQTAVHLTYLPTPDLLKREHPALFRSVFPSDDPVPPRADVGALSKVKVDCRKTSQAARRMAVMDSQQLAIVGASSSSGSAALLNSVLEMHRDSMQLLQLAYPKQDDASGLRCLKSMATPPLMPQQGYQRPGGLKALPPPPTADAASTAGRAPLEDGAEPEGRGCPRPGRLALPAPPTAEAAAIADRAPLEAGGEPEGGESPALEELGQLP